jgi:hypothetical protein
MARWASLKVKAAAWIAPSVTPLNLGWNSLIR